MLILKLDNIDTKRLIMKEITNNLIDPFVEFFINISPLILKVFEC